MEKIELTKNMLQGEGSKVIGKGIITDKEINFYGWGNEYKELKFVIVKGYIDDWCIYVESMEMDQSYDKVRDYGNKIILDMALKIVKCNDEIKGRYRI